MVCSLVMYCIPLHMRCIHACVCLNSSVCPHTCWRTVRSLPHVQGACEAVGGDTAAVWREGSAVIAQAAGAGIADALLTHPKPCGDMAMLQ